MAVPQRRTLIVLGSLVGAMTLASALLLALEPGPVTPSATLTLFSLDRDGPAKPEAVLFDTSTPLRDGRWQAIVIHDTGSQSGSAKTLGKAHEKAGLGGLGYHFVLNNGQGGPDGQIEVGFRWRHQLVGSHSRGANADWFNRKAVGVTLIGDFNAKPPTEAQMKELVWLVQKLQAQLGIPAERVFVSSTHGQGGEGRLFPTASFRQQLLRASH